MQTYALRLHERLLLALVHAWRKHCYIYAKLQNCFHKIVLSASLLFHSYPIEIAYHAYRFLKTMFSVCNMPHLALQKHGFCKPEASLLQSSEHHIVTQTLPYGISKYIFMQENMHYTRFHYFSLNKKRNVDIKS